MQNFPPKKALWMDVRRGITRKNSFSSWIYFLADPGVFELGVFFDIVGILEGLAPLPGLLGVSDVSEQTERAS